MARQRNGADDNKEQIERVIDKELTDAQEEVELDERIDQLAAELDEEFDDYNSDEDLCPGCGAPSTACACMEDNQDRYGTGLFDRDSGGYLDNPEFLEIDDDEELNK